LAEVTLCQQHPHTTQEKKSKKKEKKTSQTQQGMQQDSTCGAKTGVIITGLIKCQNSKAEIVQLERQIKGTGKYGKPLGA